MLQKLTTSGLAVAAMIAAAGGATAQGAGQGGITYDFTVGNGPGAIRMRGAVTGTPGGAVVRECVQPPGSPMQLCRMSVNGQQGPPFPMPANGPAMGGPGPGAAPFGPPMAPGWQSFGGSPFAGGPADGFQVSGQGRWGPYAGSGTFVYRPYPW